MRHLLALVILCCTLMGQAEPAKVLAPETGPQILQLVEYIGIDYAVAISPQGKVLSADEYEEMKEFAATIERMLLELPRMTEKTVLQSKAANFASLVNTKAPPAKVQAASKELSKALREVLQIVTAPTTIPDIKEGALLYQENCVSCHGAQGHGDGPLAAKLSPAPTDFHDKSRMSQLSTFALYNTITLGVEGTGMLPYQVAMTDDQRWNVALYLSGLSASDEQIAAGKVLWDEGHNESLTNLQALMTATELELNNAQGKDAVNVLAYLRRDPAAILQVNPFTVTIEWLDKSIKSYEAGDKAQAYQEALLAYLEGFETAEAVIDVVSGKEARITLEAQMGAYRSAIEASAPLDKVRFQHQVLVRELADLRENLPDAEFSPTTVFASSFIILLREGLESILIIGMLIMMIIKAERPQLLRGVHLGWIAALVAGGATWWASNALIHISGATRELAEGVTALFAAGILLYVGVWMHTHNIAHDWRSYLRNRLNKHLQEEAWFGLAVLSFLAVYREVFETILFYEALTMQIGPSGFDSLILGIVAALAVLLIVVFLMIKFGLQLPLQQFFKVTAVLIFLFAIIFVGQGIHSLEEAGQVPVWPVPFMRIDILGIYPNLFGLSIQAIILFIAIALGLKKK